LLFDEALAALRGGDAAAAARACAASLEQFPDDANLLCLAARANIALRQFPVAQRHVEHALRLQPEFAVAHDVYGDLLLAEGRAGTAAKAYEQALRLDPARAATLAKLDRARTTAAAEPAGAVRQQRGRMAFEDEIGEAERLAAEGNVQAAEDIYRNILRKDPDHVEAARLLAGVAVEHERLADAEVFLRRAVTLAPDYLRAWVDLANVQRDQDKFADAMESANKVIELAPDKPESYMVLASIVGVAGDHTAAIDLYRKVISMAPDKAGAMCSMAHHLKTIGKQDEAIAQYRAAIAARPDHSEAYWSLANLKTFRFGDDEVAAMQALLERDDLPDTARAHINNALGFEYEARADYPKAFAYFEQCSLVRRRHEVYDPVDTESTHDRVIELFDREFLSQATGDPVSPTPVFIVGLPRSGSTLIEQILASHSQVEGTHELSDLSKAVQQLRRRAPRHQRYPEFLAGMKASGWARIGRDYLESTAKYRTGAPLFIDKNPNNFVFAGLIHLALPGAKIINARRHPLDSCLGSFKQLFASGQPFSYDLTELGEYYLQYQRLMDHWHAVMPGGVLDVHYEHVVADLETEVRRLLDFCGLPFEESCLQFYKTQRAVKTASSEQVRQPIYASSVELWRRYEAQLGTLVHILEPLLNSVSAPPHPGQT
jgi:tetratricopeptide (TPR) repeat protein